MFGTGDRFEYVECSSCGTLQICDIPDLSAYYPPEYCSFELDYFDPKKSAARDFAIRSAAEYFVNGRNMIGKAIAAWRPVLAESFPAFLRTKLLRLTLRSRILDVGCGSGRLLMTLRHFGFDKLRGADPFVEHAIRYDNGVAIDKCEIDDVTGTFDLVMFHHSLEHVSHPVSALKNAYRLLDPGRYCLVRIPVVAAAWEIYRENWVQLDAPRHLSIFTEEGFRSAAGQAGFLVEHVVYDSTEFQFWGSEQVIRGLSVRDGWAGGLEYLRKAFGEKMDEWKYRSQELNMNGLGDQACFYLRRN